MKNDPVYNLKERRLFDLYGLPAVAKATHIKILNKIDSN